MKKFLICLSLCVAFINNACAQKLVVNNVDKFSKEVIKETSRETLFSVNFMATGIMYSFDFNIKKAGDVWSMPASIVTKDVVKYDENSGITLLLSNGETVMLKTAYTGIAAKEFGNGHIFDTCFILSSDDIKKLSENNVTDIRISWMDGYYDRQLKAKKQDLIKKMIALF